MIVHSLHSVLIFDIHTARFPLDCSRAALFQNSTSQIAGIVVKGIFKWPTVGRVLATVGSVLSTVGRVLATVGCVLPTVGRMLPTMGCVLPTVGRVLPIVGHVLPTVGRVRPTVGRSRTLAQNVWIFFARLLGRSVLVFSLNLVWPTDRITKMPGKEYLD